MLAGSNMREGAQQAGIMMGQELGPKSSMRDLERISVAADRVARAQFLIGEFLERFYGPQPTSEQLTCAPVSYRDNLERLFSDVERLEACVRTLSDIG